MHLSKLQTKLGPIIAIADEKQLYLLEFENRKNLNQEIEQLKIKTKTNIIPGKNKITDLIEDELNQYFVGTLTEFKTPIYFSGTEFQQLVWIELQQIPYGQTKSYAEIAKALKKPTAFRAVGNANAANQLAIIIPCHRVINNNGNLCGYAAGLENKEKLLNLEKQRV